MLLCSDVPVKAYCAACPVQSCAIPLNILTPSPISLVDPSLPPVLPLQFLQQPRGFDFWFCFKRKQHCKKSLDQSHGIERFADAPVENFLSLSFSPVLLTDHLLFAFLLPCCVLLKKSIVDFLPNSFRFLRQVFTLLKPESVAFLCTAASIWDLQNVVGERRLPAGSTSWVLSLVSHFRWTLLSKLKIVKCPRFQRHPLHWVLFSSSWTLAAATYIQSPTNANK